MNQSTRKAEKLLIGGKEKINFKEINNRNVIARIDSGAKTSSIHCEKVWVSNKDGKKTLNVIFLKPKSKVSQFKNFRVKEVRSSNGHLQKRYAIRLTVLLADTEFKTEFTLTNRDKMSYPVLLGRKFLRKGFIIDVSRNFILSGEGKSVED